MSDENNQLTEENKVVTPAPEDTNQLNSRDGNTQQEPAPSAEPQAAQASSEEQAEVTKADKFQKRIDKLTSEKWEERRSREELQRQNEALLASLAEARRSASSTAPTQTTAPAGTETSAAQQPVPISETELQSRAAAMAEEMYRKKVFNNKCNDVYSTGVDEYDDFDKSMKNFGMIGGPTSDFLETVTEMPNAHKILYTLGKDLDLAEKILKMPVAKQAIELARIEASLTKPAARAVSNAPAPVKPVDGSSRGTENPDEMSMDTWVKWRDSQLKKRGR